MMSRWFLANILRYHVEDRPNPELLHNGPPRSPGRPAIPGPLANILELVDEPLNTYLKKSSLVL